MAGDKLCAPELFLEAGHVHAGVATVAAWLFTCALAAWSAPRAIISTWA
jgi:hypothetical protein